MLLCLHSAAETIQTSAAASVLRSASKQGERLARFDVFPENPSADLLKVSDLCCPALLWSRAIESIDPSQGLEQCRSLRSGNGALSIQAEQL